MNTKNDKDRKTMKESEWENKQGEEKASAGSVSGRRRGQVLKVCASCGRELPLEEFYCSGATQRPDRYCKRCRRAVSVRNREKQYMEEVTKKWCNNRLTMLEEPDAARRMELVLQARAVVLESVRRKRAQRAASEDARIDREIEREKSTSLPREAPAQVPVPSELLFSEKESSENGALTEVSSSAGTPFLPVDAPKFLFPEKKPSENGALPEGPADEFRLPKSNPQKNHEPWHE